jgi:hypothetical protein
MFRWRRLLPRLLLPGSWFLVVCYLDPLAGMQKSIKTRNPQNSKLSLGLFFKSQNIRHLCYQIVLAILSLYFLPIIFFTVSMRFTVSIYSMLVVYLLCELRSRTCRKVKKLKFPCGLTIKALVKIRN